MIAPCEIVLLLPGAEDLEPLERRLGARRPDLPVLHLPPAPGALEGLQRLLRRQSNRAIILLDLDDRALVRQLGEIRSENGLPLLVGVSRDEGLDRQHEARAAGCDLWLKRPLEPGQAEPLLRLVEHFERARPPLQVLLVEDDQIDQRNIMRMLAEPGAVECQVTATPSGEEAIESCSQRPFDVVLLDMNLPDLHGLDVLRELRLRFAPAPPPVIAMTGYGTEHLVRDLFHLQVTDYLSKKKLNAPMLRWTLERLSGQLNRTADELLRPPHQPPERLLVVAGSAGALMMMREVAAGLKRDPLLATVILHHHSRGRSGPPFLDGLRAPRETRWIENADLLEADWLYTNRPGHDVALREGRFVSLDTRSFPRPVPSFDIFFRTAAEAYEERVTLCVLSGMADDGLRGAGRVRELGGRILVQDPASTDSPSMPSSFERAGLADALLPPGELCAQLAALCRPEAE